MDTLHTAHTVLIDRSDLLRLPMDTLHTAHTALIDRSDLLRPHLNTALHTLLTLTTEICAQWKGCRVNGQCLYGRVSQCTLCVGVFVWVCMVNTGRVQVSIHLLRPLEEIYRFTRRP